MRKDQNWIFYNKVALHANMVIESLQRCFIILFWGGSRGIKQGTFFSLPFPLFFVKISAAVMFQFVLLENFNLIFHANYPYFLDRRNGKEIGLLNSSLMFYSKISIVMHRSQRSWRSTDTQKMATKSCNMAWKGKNENSNKEDIIHVRDVNLKIQLRFWLDF